jgi:HEAT repeat protein
VNARADVADFIKQLRSNDVNVRAEAVTALGQLGPEAKDAVPTLMGMLDAEKDKGVKRLVIKTLGDIGPDAKAAVGKLNTQLARNPEAGDKQAIIIAMGQIGPASIPYLTKMVSATKEKDAAIRQLVVSALGECGKDPKDGKEALPAVRDALDDPDANVRRLAAMALGKFGANAKQSVPLLMAAMEKEKDNNVRFAMIETLGAIGSDVPAAARTLQKLSESPDGGTSQKATDGLARMGKAGVPLLAANMKSKVGHSKVFAARALAKIGVDEKDGEALAALSIGLSDPNGDIKKLVTDTFEKSGKTAAPVLVGALKHEDAAVRLNCAMLLEKLVLDDKALAPGLAVGLKDPADQIRKISAEKLAQLGPAAVDVLPDLLQVLEDKNAMVRDAGIQAIRNVGRNAVPKLIELFKEKDAVTRQNAVMILGELGKIAKDSLPDIARMTNDPDEGVRRAAVTALEKLAKDSIPALIELAKNADAGVRLGAVAALGELGAGAKESIPLLVEVLGNEKNLAVRRQAALALLGMGVEAKGVVPQMMAALKDPDKEVRQNVALAFGPLGEAGLPAIPALLAAAAEKDDTLSKNIADSLSKMGPPAIPALTQALKNTDPVIRRVAAASLRDMGPKAEGAKDQLAEALRDQDKDTRKMAALALSDIGPPAKEKVLELIYVMLRDADADVRTNAVTGLLSVSNPNHYQHLVVPALGEAIKDKSDDVRQLAAGGMARYGAAGVTYLIPSLKHADKDVRKVAVTTLGRLGGNAKPATDAIKQLVNDKDPDVKQAAQEALKQVGG